MQFGKVTGCVKVDNSVADIGSVRVRLDRMGRRRKKSCINELLDTGKWSGSGFLRPTFFRAWTILQKWREVLLHLARIEESGGVRFRAFANWEVNLRQRARLGCVGWRFLLHA